MNKLFTLLANNKRKAQSRAIEMKGDEATLYIYDAIVSDDITAEWFGGVSAQTIVPQIRAIKGGTLHLRINSPGGDVFAAQAIVAAIRDTGANVIAHVDGFAASAATVVATAADSIEISDGALYMIHCGWCLTVGNATDMRSTADLLDKVDATIVKQYAKRTGKSVEEVMALMTAETWMTAQEAVDMGFVNSITAPSKVKASWDLSAYEKAPKQEQEEPIVNDQREYLNRKLRVKTLTPHH